MSLRQRPPTTINVKQRIHHHYLSLPSTSPLHVSTLPSFLSFEHPTDWINVIHFVRRNSSSRLLATLYCIREERSNMERVNWKGFTYRVERALVIGCGPFHERGDGPWWMGYGCCWNFLISFKVLRSRKNVLGLLQLFLMLE